MNYYVAVIKKYVTFSGRAGRAEYWYFTLFSFLISLGLRIVSAVIGDRSNILGVLYAIFVFLPGLAVLVRRLHDIGKSAWMLLLLLIPLVGVIWIFVLTVMGSDVGLNAYGQNPHGITDLPPQSLPPNAPPTATNQ